MPTDVCSCLGMTKNSLVRLCLEMAANMTTVIELTQLFTCDMVKVKPS